jgi:hypothetical protein
VSTAIAGTIGADAQRIFISVHGGVTDVTQIGARYDRRLRQRSGAGELTPDPARVAVELDTLFSATAPSAHARVRRDQLRLPDWRRQQRGGAEPPIDTKVSEPVAIDRSRP